MWEGNEKAIFNLYYKENTLLNLPGTFEPDFDNLLKVLKREEPSRPTLFEFFVGDDIARTISGIAADEEDHTKFLKMLIRFSQKAGYDYTTIPTWHTDTLWFDKGEVHEQKSKSQNEGAVITDQRSFNEYPWPDPEEGYYEIYDDLKDELPDGMKLVGCGPGGLLENVTELVGFENLCMLYMLEPDLTQEIFDAVGSRLLRYYEILTSFDSVGAVISNDDWGFKTQTMFPPEMMQQYVFPWHKRIVEASHANGKPVILHSCGNIKEVIDAIIDDMKYDAKHSFEDQIIPVEQAYEEWGGRIAIIGGIDVDFIMRGNPEDIYRRAKAMLERSEGRGGYALGSGNSIPDYIPMENYLAMIKAAWE